MKHPLFYFMLLVMMSGCAILENPLFWRITVGGVLRAAYESGGAEMVGERIDCLEEKGKLSSESAEKLKDAAQKGYDKLQDKLDEVEADDILIDDEMLGAVEE